MPSRLAIARELAEIFKLVAHPDRIRIVEELGREERDVNTLADKLQLPGSRVSQHLAKLRAHRIVEERRDGRHHYYHLTHPDIAQWIVDGVEFIEKRTNGVSERDIRSARRAWSST